MGGGLVKPLHEIQHKLIKTCIFCGGSRCKHETYTRQKPENNAIHGLHSSWITDDMVACQRPSTRIISEFNIIEQFIRHGIGAIINLQERGEHPNCGDGIHDSGFSYCAEDFMHSQILFYNFGWKDMGAPTLDQMINIVQVMCFSIDAGKKIAIHCHAGLGRTGLVVASYMIYSTRSSLDEVITTVRASRPGSIQTRVQVTFLKAFFEYVKQLRLQFVKLSLSEAMNRQRRYLHGEQRSQFLHTPRLVSVCCQSLFEWSKRSDSDLAFVANLLWRLASNDSFSSEVVEKAAAVKAALDVDDWSTLPNEEATVVAVVLGDWLHSLEHAVLASELFSEAVNNVEELSAVLHQQSLYVQHIILCFLPLFALRSPSSPTTASDAILSLLTRAPLPSTPPDASDTPQTQLSRLFSVLVATAWVPKRVVVVGVSKSSSASSTPVSSTTPSSSHAAAAAAATDAFVFPSSSAVADESLAPSSSEPIPSSSSSAAPAVPAPIASTSSGVPLASRTSSSGVLEPIASSSSSAAPAASEPIAKPIAIFSPSALPPITPSKRDPDSSSSSGGGGGGGGDDDGQQQQQQQLTCDADEAAVVLAALQHRMPASAAARLDHPDVALPAVKTLTVSGEDIGLPNGDHLNFDDGGDTAVLGGSARAVIGEGGVS